MSDQEKEIAWEKSGKGRGNRWQMLRDIVALLSLRSMSVMQLQDCLLNLRGLTRNKVRELMEDLERAKAIKQVTGQVQGIVQHGWAATDFGVAYWVKSRQGIPVRIAQVAATLDAASQTEG